MKSWWIEVELGRYMGRTYPWLARVKRLPGGGLVTACGFWHGEAANDSLTV